jgi:hypothetical protein
MNESNKLEYSLTSDEIMELNPDARFVIYTELNKIYNLYELFANHDKIIILYLLENSHSGHYVCLFLDEDDRDIIFFDSYAMPPDGELQELPKLKRMRLNELQDRLQILLAKTRFKYNKTQFQGEGTETCGMFVTHRLHNSKMNNHEYANLIKKSKKNPDLLVADYCLKLFKNL